MAEAELMPISDERLAEYATFRTKPDGHVYINGDAFRSVARELQSRRSTSASAEITGALIHNLMPAKAANQMTMADFEALAANLRTALSEFESTRGKG